MSSVDINKYTPYRKGNMSVVKSSENQCEHIGNNPDRNYIRQFKVDGDVLTVRSPEQRCDFLVLNDTGLRSYYIELKGSDIVRAIDQIENSIRMISPSIQEYTVFRRIVYRTGSHQIQDNAVTKWKLKHAGKVKVGGRQIDKVVIHSRRIEDYI